MANIDLRKLNVLVVDDEPFMRNLVKRVLIELEITKVSEAGNGDEALAKVKEAEGAFDLIICDLEMPKMDGVEFVRRLRDLTGFPNTNVPVLIVTGHSEVESVKEAVAAGIHGYLVKPISKQALEKRIVAAITSPLIDPEKLK
jgi:two-component system chemotaxis response regulator CheY